jgi:tetratricopeptide (TPR) repeat protein
MSAGQRPEENSKKKSYLFFTLGAVFLLVMGFFWSLDSSIVNVLLGISVFFFFLGFWYYPWKTIQRPFSKSQQRTNPQQPHPQEKSTVSAIRELEKEILKSTGESSQSTKSENPFVARQKSIQMMVIGVFVVGFVFILMVTFSAADGGGDAEAEYYFAMAENFRNADQFDSSRIYYLRAVKADPEYLDAWNNYGLLWMSKQQYDTAFRIFDHIQSIDEVYEFSRYNKALIHYWQKNYRKSLDEDLELIDISPYNNDAIQLAGDNYYDQQRYDSALYWYQKGYDNGHRNAWLCHVMGYLYDTKGETEKAIALYKEAVNMAPNKVDVFVRLGQLIPGPEGEQFRMQAEQLKKEGH